MKTLFRVLFQAMAHDVLKAMWNGGIGLRNFRRVVAQNGGVNIGKTGPIKGALAGKHLVQDGAEGEDIRTRVGSFAADLLRRHIAGCAHHRAGHGVDIGIVEAGLFVGNVGLAQLGDAEVKDLDAPIFAGEDVFRLEVSVYDAFFVGGGQTVGDLDGIINRFANRRPSVSSIRDEGG